MRTLLIPALAALVLALVLAPAALAAPGQDKPQDEAARLYKDIEKLTKKLTKLEASLEKAQKADDDKPTSADLRAVQHRRHALRQQLADRMVAWKGAHAAVEAGRPGPKSPRRAARRTGSPRAGQPGMPPELMRRMAETHKRFDARLGRLEAGMKKLFTLFEKAHGDRKPGQGAAKKAHAQKQAHARKKAQAQKRALAQKKAHAAKRAKAQKMARAAKKPGHGKKAHPRAAKRQDAAPPVWAKRLGHAVKALSARVDRLEGAVKKLYAEKHQGPQRGRRAARGQRRMPQQRGMQQQRGTQPMHRGMGRRMEQAGGPMGPQHGPRAGARGPGRRGPQPARHGPGESRRPGGSRQAMLQDIRHLLTEALARLDRLEQGRRR